MLKPSIYISYAWGDSPETEEELALKELCNALTSHGFDIVLDRTHLDYHQSLLDFYRIIGEGGIVIPIVGRKYLLRLNCLIEASIMIIRGDITQRIFPLVLSDNYQIYDKTKQPTIISELEGFWKNKEEEVLSALNFNNSLGHGKLPFRRDIQILHQIISTISDFISHVGNSKQFNFEDELKERFKNFIDYIIQKTKEKVERPYYQKIESEYFGREKDIELITAFLQDEQKHFLLLSGVGGMGKTHLLSVCLDKFNYERKFYWVKADNSFELRDLYKACNLRYPLELQTTKQICNHFLDEFSSNNIFLIIDDFYEIVDSCIRKMLPDLTCLPSGKLLIISRAIPKEIEKQIFAHHQLLSLERVEFKKAMFSYISAENKKNFSDEELNKIFDKVQGYPLGGQLIIRLADFGDKIDEILNALPKFEAELDVEGKKFSDRLLDNIFNKANPEEISLLCEFSSLFGFPSLNEIRYLPSFKLEHFNTLVNRRKFISKDRSGIYSAHAMIKDYAYEKLLNKETIHRRMGDYFERKLKGNMDIDWGIVESAILHYQKVGKQELKLFGQRMFGLFRNRDVKTVIEQSLINTIRNYSNLIEIYPNYMPYYNELGMALVNNNEYKKAIETFLKGLKIDPDNKYFINFLKHIYREPDGYNEALKTYLNILNEEPSNVRAYEEIGTLYGQAGQYDEAINIYLNGLKIDPINERIINPIYALEI